jgi:uncharacterized protein YhaN
MEELEDMGRCEIDNIVELIEQMETRLNFIRCGNATAGQYIDKVHPDVQLELTTLRKENAELKQRVEVMEHDHRQNKHFRNHLRNWLEERSSYLVTGYMMDE